MPDTQEKDQNVLSVMMELVQRKYGNEVDSSFLLEEANKLYDGFGEALVSFFEPLMSDRQKMEFEKLADQKRNDLVLEFLMREIPELDTKIRHVLIAYKNNYLNS